MTITHHPTDHTIAAFAAGTLDEGRALVVAAHLSLCPACRSATRGFEEIAGAFLDRIEPVAMHEDALRRALAEIGNVAPAYREEGTSPPPVGQELPPPLAEYGVGPWRWIGRGVHWRSVEMPAGGETRVFMLKAEPGTRLPHHRHKGIEWTCVLEGAFRHDLGRYGPGDFDEADDTVEHNPTVEEGVACICLVALQGGIEFKGWIGRLLQPFVRI